MNEIATILVNYNGLKDTIECIKSIEVSTLKADIIVVDNASSDNDLEQIKTRFSNVIGIQSEYNLGFSGGNNLGIKYALKNGYKYIMLLNNDTIIDKEMIYKLKKHSTENCICAPVMYYYDKPNLIWYGGGYINKYTGNAKHYFIKQDISEIDLNDLKKNISSFATGCCWFLCSDIFKKIGFLEEKYFMYCEDTEFCIRLALNNICIKLIDDAKLWHKVSSSTGGETSEFAVYYMTRNRLNYIKEYNKFFFFTAYPFSVFSRIYRMIEYTLKKDSRGKAIYKGIKDHLKNR